MNEKYVPKEPAIYLNTFELTKEIMIATRHFPKPNRYVLGRKIEELFLQFLLGINKIIGPSGVRSTEHEKRYQSLLRLSIKLDEIRVLLRMASETGCLSQGQFVGLADQVNFIGRQLGGLLRKSKQRYGIYNK